MAVGRQPRANAPTWDTQEARPTVCQPYERAGPATGKAGLDGDPPPAQSPANVLLKASPSQRCQESATKRGPPARRLRPGREARSRTSLVLPTRGAGKGTRCPADLALGFSGTNPVRGPLAGLSRARAPAPTWRGLR